MACSAYTRVTYSRQLTAPYNVAFFRAIMSYNKVSHVKSIKPNLFGKDFERKELLRSCFTHQPHPPDVAPAQQLQFQINSIDFIHTLMKA
jgi:hypothetical protein